MLFSIHLSHYRNLINVLPSNERIALARYGLYCNYVQNECSDIKEIFRKTFMIISKFHD